MLIEPTPMKEIERTNTVMVCPNKQAVFAP